MADAKVHDSSPAVQDENSGVSLIRDYRTNLVDLTPAFSSLSITEPIAHRYRNSEPVAPDVSRQVKK